MRYSLKEHFITFHSMKNKCIPTKYSLISQKSVTRSSPGSLIPACWSSTLSLHSIKTPGCSALTPCSALLFKTAGERKSSCLRDWCFCKLYIDVIKYIGVRQWVWDSVWNKLRCYLESSTLCCRSLIHSCDVNSQSILRSSPDHQTQRSSVIQNQVNLEKTHKDEERQLRRG